MSDAQSITQTWAIDAGDSNRRFRILAIPGSLRQRSYNRGLLEAAADEFVAALRLDPAHYVATANLARVRLLQGEPRPTAV